MTAHCKSLTRARDLISTNLTDLFVMLNELDDTLVAMSDSDANDDALHLVTEIASVLGITLTRDIGTQHAKKDERELFDQITNAIDPFVPNELGMSQKVCDEQGLKIKGARRDEIFDHIDAIVAIIQGK